MPASLRSIVAGCDRFPAGHRIPRHRHSHAYAIVTLDGSMEQASYAGRIITRPGQFLVQPTLDCHANRAGPLGVRILRLPWRRETGLGGLFEIAEFDRVVRLAERDTAGAAELADQLLQSAEKLWPLSDDWEDLLAEDLAAGRVGSLSQWAARHHLAAETLSRGFARRYHCTPAQFRSELRTRNAWLRLTASQEPLAGVAAETGFSDQAHMTREIRRITGNTPGHWRARASLI